MLNLQIQSRGIELVSLSHRIVCTHHPSGFPLARPTSFSFVLALSFCLKTAKNGRKPCYLLNFPNASRSKMAHSSRSCNSKRLQRILGVSQCILGLSATQATGTATGTATGIIVVCLFVYLFVCFSMDFRGIANL